MVRYHDLDRGTKGTTETCYLHPYDPSFSKLPAQGALLIVSKSMPGSSPLIRWRIYETDCSNSIIDGFESIRTEQFQELSRIMVGEKYLVKVDSVTYEDTTDRCVIRGDLFHFGILRMG